MRALRPGDRVRVLDVEPTVADLRTLGRVGVVVYVSSTTADIEFPDLLHNDGTPLSQYYRVVDLGPATTCRRRRATAMA